MILIVLLFLFHLKKKQPTNKSTKSVSTRKIKRLVKKSLAKIKKTIGEESIDSSCDEMDEINENLRKIQERNKETITSKRRRIFYSSDVSY